MNKKLILIGVIIFIAVLAVASASYFVYSQYEYTNTQFDKPAIYLYPESDSQISVKLDINGKLKRSIPSYEDGWDVYVTKDGVIENQYDYLFYENELDNLEFPENGWVVAKKDLYMWFDKYLPLLGLNEKETIQFKEYWLYRLIDSEYYEIRLLNQDFLDENMDLIISPDPDTQIRLIFSFKAVDKPYEIMEPNIITPKRDGFTVVEWGGTLVK